MALMIVENHATPGLHLIGEPQLPQRRAEQNGTHFAMDPSPGQLEAVPRFFSEIQHAGSNVQYVSHPTLAPLNLCLPQRYLLGRQKYVDK
jgi:hypothetical protein